MQSQRKPPTPLCDDPLFRFLFWETFHLSALDEAGYVMDEASAEDRARIEKHLSVCEACREDVAALRAYDAAPLNGV